MNTIIKDTIKLFIITLIAGAALGGVHELTLKPIAAARQQAANETYAQVFSAASSFETTDELTAKVASVAAETAGWGYGKVSIDEVMEAHDASGALLGYMVNATSGDGYGGDVQITVGINNEDKITGLGFLSISETPGLGMKAKEPAFYGQFPGKSAAGDLQLVKTGNAGDDQMDAISGASYTSGAVNNAVNAAIRFYQNYLK